MHAEGSAIDVRRVGFRSGTDAELAAMHLVESEIQSERRPEAAAQPLHSYLAFARSLPQQFEDHTWLAQETDGTPVGCAACWSDTAGDARVMESYVYLRRAWRRQRVGARLAKAVVEEAAAEGGMTLMWSTYDAVPAGAEFSIRIGGTVGRVNRTSELLLADVDWEQVGSWTTAAPHRAPGYTLQFWEGPFPDHLADDAARFHHIMNTQPRDDLEVGDVVLDASHVADIDRHLAASGRERWTVFVRAPDGSCVGGTELTFEPWEPTLAQQQNTATDPNHRGIGLATWAKAAMLERLRRARPDVLRVRTSNALSNDAMLAINTALGFRVVEMRTEWQGAIAAMRAKFRQDER